MSQNDELLNNLSDHLDRAFTELFQVQRCMELLKLREQETTQTPSSVTTAPVEKPKKVKHKDVIREVLSDASGHGLDFAGLFDKLVQRGHFEDTVDDRNVLRGAIASMASRGEIKRTPKLGKFSLVKQKAPKAKKSVAERKARSRELVDHVLDYAHTVSSSFRYNDLKDHLERKGVIEHNEGQVLTGVLLGRTSYKGTSRKISDPLFVAKKGPNQEIIYQAIK